MLAASPVGVFLQRPAEIRVERAFPLEQTAAAHQQTANGHTTGKIVLTVQHTAP